MFDYCDNRPISVGIERFMVLYKLIGGLAFRDKKIDNILKSL
jgi:hypothetical protein